MKVDRVTFKTASPWILASYALSFISSFLLTIYIDKSLGFKPHKIIWVLIMGGLWWLLSRLGKLLLTREVTASFGESALALSWSEHYFFKPKEDIIIHFNQIRKYKLLNSRHSSGIKFWLVNGKRKTFSAPNDEREVQSFFFSLDKELKEGDYPDLIRKPPFEKTKTALVMAWISGLILLLFIAAYFITQPKGGNWVLILVSFISIWTFIKSVVRARSKKD